MTTIPTKIPVFFPAQQVSFMGGEGIVKSCRHEIGIWTYVVEMALGPKPDFGRLGPETMVIFSEADLCAA
jgi:hypothetical protein